jgi:hypothetical protein
MQIVYITGHSDYILVIMEPKQVCQILEVRNI